MRGRGAAAGRGLSRLVWIERINVAGPGSLP